jgi:hypothetical protein
MKILTLKSLASAFAALALTVVVSWTFVDGTSLARIQPHASGNAGFIAAISALVR